MLIDEPASCRECGYNEFVFGIRLCRMMCHLGEHPELDIHTVEIKDQDSLPDWCPIASLNHRYSEMPKETRDAMDRITEGLKMLNQIMASK